MRKLRETRVPTAGLEALRVCIEKLTPRLHSLPPDDLLTLRSALTLYERLEFCAETNTGISAALFSPLDLAVIKELVAANPERSGALTELLRAIEQEVAPHDSSR